MTEHGFLAVMLGLVAFETLVALYLGYRVHRNAERIERLTAAAYLEARKALTQSR